MIVWGIESLKGLLTFTAVHIVWQMYGNIFHVIVVLTSNSFRLDKSMFFEMN